MIGVASTPKCPESTQIVTLDSALASRIRLTKLVRVLKASTKRAK